MGTLDGPARKVALKLIEKFGKWVTLRFETEGDYDPSTLSNTLTPSDQTVKALNEQYKARFQSGETGVTVEVGDRQLTIAAKGLNRAPVVGDKVLIDSDEYEIKDLDPVYSGDEVAIYLLHVRR